MDNFDYFPFFHTFTNKLNKNYGVAPDKPNRNKYCTIRKGILVTAPKEDLESLLDLVE